MKNDAAKYQGKFIGIYVKSDESVNDASQWILGKNKIWFDNKKKLWTIGTSDPIKINLASMHNFTADYYNQTK